MNYRLPTDMNVDFARIRANAERLTDRVKKQTPDERIAELEAALKPFAKLCLQPFDDDEFCKLYENRQGAIYVGDINRAYRALNRK